MKQDLNLLIERSQHLLGKPDSGQLPHKTRLLKLLDLKKVSFGQ